MQKVDIDQLDGVVDVVVRVLGDAVVGIYMYGSAVLGGLRPLSDLDVLVLIDRSTTTDQRQGLLEEMRSISVEPGTSRDGRPLEVTVVNQGDVRPWRSPPRRESQYGEWLRNEYEAGAVPSPGVDADLAALLSTALTTSNAIIGPRLGGLIGPVPHQDLVSSMLEGIPTLQAELADDTCNVLLTLARMWYTTCTGEIAAKDVAANWALTRMPKKQRGALEHARAVYLGEQDASFDSVEGASAFLAEAITGAATG